MKRETPDALDPASVVWPGQLRKLGALRKQSVHAHRLSGAVVLNLPNAAAL